jgi:hypothetical protein
MRTAVIDRSIRIRRSVELDRHAATFQPVLVFLAVSRMFHLPRDRGMSGRPIAALRALTELTASAPIANRIGSGV